MTDPFVLFTIAATIVGSLILISVLTLKYRSLKAVLAAQAAAAAHAAELQAQIELQRQAEIELQIQTQIQARLEPLYLAIHQKETELIEYRAGLIQQDQVRLQELQLLRQQAWQSALSQAQAQLQEWRERDLETISVQQKTPANQEALLRLEEWKTEQEQNIRADARARSQSVLMGKITEHFVPYLPEFCFNPKDARFFGSPVDFLVFDGMDEGDIRQVVFVEIKTGKSNLTTRERQIKNAVDAGRVHWKELRPKLLTQDSAVDTAQIMEQSVVESIGRRPALPS